MVHHPLLRDLGSCVSVVEVLVGRFGLLGAQTERLVCRILHGRSLSYCFVLIPIAAPRAATNATPGLVLHVLALRCASFLSLCGIHGV